MSRPLCFVLMPFGKKPDAAGSTIDFDAVYRDLIRPSIEKAGLDPLRADEEMTGGILHKPMFERLILCEYAVADLTTAMRCGSGRGWFPGAIEEAARLTHEGFQSMEAPQVAANHLLDGGRAGGRWLGMDLLETLERARIQIHRRNCSRNLVGYDCNVGALLSRRATGAKGLAKDSIRSWDWDSHDVSRFSACTAAPAFFRQAIFEGWRDWARGRRVASFRSGQERPCAESVAPDREALKGELSAPRRQELFETAGWLG